MSNRDNGSEFDYYELRRRHQEYKSRMRTTQPAEPVPKSNPVPAPDPGFQPEEPLHVDEIADAPVHAPISEPVDIPAPESVGAPSPEPVDVPASEPEDADPLANFVLSDEEAYEDEDYEGDMDGANPNPFDSFIRFFHGVKGNISARRQAQEDEEFDALDDDITDEELAELEAEERKSSRRLRRHAGDELSDSESDDFDDEDFDDEDFDDEDFEDEEDDRRPSGFKRFLNLFVTRVDEEYEEDDDIIEEMEIDYDQINNHTDSGISIHHEGSYSAHSNTEGGQTMDEMNKPVSGSIQQMAEGLEASGMSRRERRERAMRLAAEEAARKAAEETPLKVEDAVQQEEATSVADEPAASPVSEPLTEAENTIETAVDPMDLIVEEPTREFTPVSLRALDEDKQAIFDLENEGEEADEEDDEEEEDEETPRKGLFSRLRGRKQDEEDEEDEEEEDDDEDEDEEDDEDEGDEDERPSKFRLFGRRSQVNDDDDEDDDDEYDDDDDEYDDEDEEDEYDEYEDDEDDDDEYDYDDEDVHHSIGYHIIGVFKWVLRIIFVLLICVIVLNFLYVAGKDTIVPSMHEAMGDSTAFHLLFFGYDVRQLRQPAEVVEPAAVEEDAGLGEEAEEIPEPESTIAIPDLDSNGEITESPVVDVAPVIESEGETGGSVG